MKKSLTLLLLTLFTVSFTFAQSDKRLRGLDKELESLLEDYKASGFAVAVVDRDQIIYSRGFGLRDRENNLPVTPNTLFAIGSCSKAFTSAILGQLQQETDLSLDDRPAKYIEGFQFYNDELNNQITITDMMCHRTGLPRHDYSWYFFPTNDRDSLIRRVEYQEPAFGIREQWYYNNFMFLAQGVIAENITGKSWEQNIQERFFEPLNMNRSNVDIEGLVADDDHAVGYETVRDSAIRRMDYYNIAAMSPAGSINSSVTEMANWVRTWINGGKWNGEQIIPSNYLRDAISSQMIVNNGLPDPEVPDVHMVTYGYGWFIASYRGHYRVEHGGNIDGFSANTAFFPTDSIGIVVLANQNGSPIPTLVRNIVADRMLELEPVDWNARIQKQRMEGMKAQEEMIASIYADRQKNTSPSHDQSAYTGTFTSPAAGKVKIFIRDDSLFMKSSQYELWLQHYHYDVFQPMIRRPFGIDTTRSMMRILFQTDAGGEIAGFDANIRPPQFDPVKFVRIEDEVKMSAEDLKKYAGEYELEGVTARFYIKDDDKLHLTVPNQPEYTLIATGDNTFSIKDLKGFTIKFTVEGNQAVKAVFNQPNGIFTAERKQ